MRRACNRLIEQGLIKTSSSRNWERYRRNLSPVGYVPTFGTEQKVVFSKDYVIGG